MQKLEKEQEESDQPLFVEEYEEEMEAKDKIIQKLSDKRESDFLPDLEDVLLKVGTKKRIKRGKKTRPKIEVEVERETTNQ